MLLRVIDGIEVRKLLPMEECIDVMEAAMLAASSGNVAMAPRLALSLVGQSAHFGLMPGFSAELNMYGAKVISLHPSNAAKGLPSVQGLIALFDYENGEPVAIIEGGQITAIRTAAASGLATRLLGREDAQTCGIFGTGVQAVSHISAMAAVRPVREFVIWGRTEAKAHALVKELTDRYEAIFRVTREPEDAAACDIICTVTRSVEPLIHGEWVQPGAHVNLVGAHLPTAREADTSLMQRAAIYTDLMESARNEAGDILIPVSEGALAWEDVRGEIGCVINGEILGRQSDEEVTIYKSLGIIAQDLFAACSVLEKALTTGVGTDIEL